MQFPCLSGSGLLPLPTQRKGGERCVSWALGPSSLCTPDTWRGSGDGPSQLHLSHLSSYSCWTWGLRPPARNSRDPQVPGQPFAFSQASLAARETALEWARGTESCSWCLPDSLTVSGARSVPSYFHVSHLEGQEGLRWKETLHVERVNVPQVSRSNVGLPSFASLSTSSSLTNRHALSLMCNFFVF